MITYLISTHTCMNTSHNTYVQIKKKNTGSTVQKDV